jgi:hypothetical protein
MRGEVKNQQGSANPYACICGYEGTSNRDLDEHIAAAGDDEDHAPRRLRSQRTRNNAESQNAMLCEGSDEK